MQIWHDLPKLRHLTLACYWLVALLWLAAGTRWLTQHPYFQLRQVQVLAKPGTTLQYVTVPTLRAGTLSYLQAGQNRTRPQSLFTVNLEALRQAFETVPWVRSASIRRVWPNQLQVEIEEQRALAQWGENQLVNRWGEVFIANLDEAEQDGPLPKLDGPENTAPQVVARYLRLQPIFQPMLASLPRANPEDAEQHRLTGVARLSLSSRYAWQVVLSDGMKIELGRDRTDADWLANIQRLIEVYPQLQKTLAQRLEYVDLRYSNGFAVRTMDAAPIHRISSL